MRSQLMRRKSQSATTSEIKSKEFNCFSRTVTEINFKETLHYKKIAWTELWFESALCVPSHNFFKKISSFDF